MILITGATGLLGSTLTPILTSNGKNITTHANHGIADWNADLTKKEQVYNLLDTLNPNMIVNLVGLTSVERCQDFPNEAYLINTKTVENLVHWIDSRSTKTHLIHISTDQVYDGPNEHTEDAITLTNFYSFSKYASELAALKVPSTILRTNFVGRSKNSNRESLTDWVYKAMVSGNFVQVLNDVHFNPLSMAYLSNMINLVIDKRPLGIFNLGSRGGMSKADFDFKFAEKLNLPTMTMQKINTTDADFLKAYRPKNMVMNCSKFESALGIQLPTILDQIESIAKEYDVSI